MQRILRDLTKTIGLADTMQLVRRWGNRALRVPAKVRGVSYEPALGAVDFTPYLPGCDRDCEECDHEYQHMREAQIRHERPTGRVTREPPHRVGIDWLIVGGESGPGARPFDLAWARSAVQQCKAASVAVFVKQLGTNPQAHGVSLGRIPGKGGNISHIPHDLRIREFPPC